MPVCLSLLNIVSFYHSVKCSFDLYIHLLIVLYVFLSTFYWLIYLSFSALIIYLLIYILIYCTSVYLSMDHSVNLPTFISLSIYMWTALCGYSTCLCIICSILFEHLLLIFFIFFIFYCTMRLLGCFGRLLIDLVQKNPSWSLCDVRIPKYCLNQSFIVCIYFLCFMIFHAKL